MSHRAPTAPRLEFFQQGVDELQSVLIERTPFKIGRCESSDLRIDSVEVSREHAQIFRRGSIWIIRDLGSTNGTKVNGKPIRESFLADGDLLSIAETEVSFVAASVTPIQRMATQPIQQRESSKPTALLPPELSQIRALTEATLMQSIGLQWAPAVSLTTGHTEACFAHVSETPRSDADVRAFHAVGALYRELCQLRVVECVAAESVANRIFVPTEFVGETPEELVAKIDQLRNQMPAELELGVLVSLSKFGESQMLDHLCREVCQAEVLLACSGFQGGSGQVLELEAYAPDYLLFSDAMLRGVTSGSQPSRRLEQVLATCKQLGIQPVLPESDSRPVIAHCRQLGYELVLQTVATVEKPSIDDLVLVSTD